MDRVELENLGFQGFIRFDTLLDQRDQVPRQAGEYAISCETDFVPNFVDPGTGGRFKGLDPNVPEETLKAAWLLGTQVLYFGKAGPGKRGDRGLRKRLVEYARFGNGKAVGHRGGRYIWQLSDANELLVSWRIEELDYDALETRLLKDFKAEFGEMPFANLAVKKG